MHQRLCPANQASRRLLAAALLALQLSACGGGGDAGAAPAAPTPTATPTPSPSPTPPPVTGAAPRTTLLTSSLSSPWGMAFLPDARMLITQKGGTMVIVSADGRSVSAAFRTGLPNLATSGQGGLLDVALDPDFDLASNPRIYWTFS